ncbi:MAG: FtsX-like permease family protein [Propionibacteriaceae bacterium]|jgi:putative ABC transport system permease protein|nr:FtsX-like permease family protein [Propionibacteriaceae bacterium]
MGADKVDGKASGRAGGSFNNKSIETAATGAQRRPRPAARTLKSQAMAWRMLRASLTRRRARVVIALLAVAIGATALSALAAIAIDIPRQMAREMRAYGANLLILPEPGRQTVPASTTAQIDGLVGDGDLLGRAPYRYQTVRINSQPYLAAGTDLAAVRQVSPYWQVEGEWPSRDGQLLVGADIAAWIGLAPGDGVELEMGDSKQRFTASGVLSTGGGEDSLIVMGLEDLGQLAGESGQYDLIEYSVAVSGGDVEALADRVNATVSGVSAAGVKRLTESDAYVLGLLKSLLGLIAVIVLALTMIGVSTTMMAVVAERRAEIALRKALGASNRSVEREFLGEALALGALGGALGAALGHLCAELISRNVFHRHIGVTWWLPLVAVVASTAVAWAASLIPVRRAAEVDPAIVLREE